MLLLSPKMFYSHPDATLSADIATVRGKSYKSLSLFLSETGLDAGGPEPAGKQMLAFLIFLCLEGKQAMNKDSPLHHPKGRERRKGKRRRGKEGKGREGKGKEG